ncbi:MAG: L,D-transpeptidase [bacterium]|nr:L,D-transpeptidase [bacterium]
MKKIHGVFLSIAGVLLSAAFLFAQPVLAQPEREPMLKVTDSSSLAAAKNWLAFDKEFRGGGTVAVGDLGGDGTLEIVVGAGPGGGPQIRVFRQDGSEITNFFAYDEKYHGGVRVAVGDLDADGKAEIITGTGRGGGPQVRVFDGYGNLKFTPGFFPFAEEYRGGVHVAACDTNGNGQDEIIVGSGYDSLGHVRAFDRFGVFTGLDYRPFSANEKGGVSVGCVNADGGSEEELIFGVNTFGSAWVKVYKTDADRSLIGDFYAFPESFYGGLNVAGGDVDGDGYGEVVVAVNSGGGPQVRAFEAYGKAQGLSYFAYEEEFRGGVHLAVADLAGSDKADIITLPGRRVAEGRTDLKKYIAIDLASQTLTYYENGFKYATYEISSGRPGMDTPTGEYRVLNKNKEAYSAAYGLYMPNWMAFTNVGHGIHGLPFWKLRGGGVYYEGEDHLGLKVSHGCVRLPVPASNTVWERVEVGTPIIIR